MTPAELVSVAADASPASPQPRGELSFKSAAASAAASRQPSAAVSPQAHRSADQAGPAAAAASEAAEAFVCAKAVAPALDPTVTAEEFAALLLRWTDASITTPVATGCHIRDIFTLKHRAPLPLAAFVQRVFDYSACEATCFTVALVYIHRITTAPCAAHLHSHCCAPGTTSPFASLTASPSPQSLDARASCPLQGAPLVVTPFNVHRLIAATITLAIKATQDVYHPMTYYGSVFGVGAVDLRRMESALMTLLDHRLHVARPEAERVVAMARAAAVA